MNRAELLQLAEVRELARRGEARAIRTAAGLSLGEVADHVGVGVGTVPRWETGERRPHGRAALRYAQLLRSLRDGGMTHISELVAAELEKVRRLAESQ